MKTFWHAAFCALMISAAVAHGADWRPAKAVEIIIPTSPGGAVDQTGRLFQKMLLGRIGVDVTVLNKGGQVVRLPMRCWRKNKATDMFYPLAL